MLPDHLRQLGNIGDALFFQGGGRQFTIWNPAELMEMGDEWEAAKAACAQFAGRGQGQVTAATTAPVTPGAPHIPVLLDEVIAALEPQPGDVIVDATFGAGGYTRALLDAGRDRPRVRPRSRRDRRRADSWPKLRKTRRGWFSIRAASPRWSPRWPMRESRGSTGS